MCTGELVSVVSQGGNGMGDMGRLRGVKAVVERHERYFLITVKVVK